MEGKGRTGMEEKTGVARLRQAVENQAACGSGQFELPFDSADRLLREIGDDIGWAGGVPAPKDAEGREIPLDTKVLYNEGGKCLKVNHFTYSVVQTIPGLKWGVVFMDCRYDYCSSFYLTPPEPPDSWERVADELEGLSVDSMISDINLVSACALDLAKHIRKLAKRETMTSNEGRRRAVAELRKASTGAYRHVDVLDVIANSIGVDIAGKFDYEAEKEIYAALADLIDPKGGDDD